MTQQADFGALEQLIDAGGLEHVLDTLAAICREKAEHLRTNWQDGRAAKAWDRDADKIEALAVEN